MHKTRREAKFAAWSDRGNPFARYRSPHHNRDDVVHLIENGEGPLDGAALEKSNTDGDYRPTTPHERKHEFGIKTPPKNATAPNAHSNFSEGQDNIDAISFPQNSSPLPSLRSVDRDGLSPTDAEKTDLDDKGKDSTSSQTAVAEETSGSAGQDAQNGARQRKRGGLKKFFHRKSKDEDKDEKPKQKFTVMGQLRATVFGSWINVLLIACPVGIACYYAKVNPVAVFVINFIAIVPLAGLLSYATEEIALRTGETIGGLLNASFGNAVELIVSIIALLQGQNLIVQTSLIGSMLSNLLLVMGMCFFFGGFNRVEQAFNMTVAQTASSLLFLAVSSLILPTAFHSFSGAGETGIRQISHATAILLLFVYACYIFFQLKTHADMYNAKSEKNKKKDMGKHAKKFKNKLRRNSKVPAGRKSPDPSDLGEEKGGEEDKEEPQLSVPVAIFTLAASTALVALNAEYLVDSINAITCTGNGISKNFVGLILLPIVGNAAEHATAVTVAVKDKMDLAIGVAVGSSMQIALLVLPFTVVLGWIIDNDNTSKLTLVFDGFQITVLFVAVLLVNYLIQDGKSHWLEGVLLQVLYLIIAVAAWFYPAKSDDCPS